MKNTETNISLSAMKAQVNGKKKHLVKVSKQASSEKQKAAIKENKAKVAGSKKKKAIKVSTDVKAKKEKAEKKVIDKAANLDVLLQKVEKVFSKGYALTKSDRVSRFGGMVKVSIANTKHNFEIWDELEVNNRICIFADSDTYNTYVKELKPEQRKGCIDHPKWKLSKQIYIDKADIDTTLKTISTKCAALAQANA